MSTSTSAIARLVEHHQGPSRVSSLLGGKPVYQEVQRWVARGWASPMHILALEPHLPPGMTIRDLYLDRERVRGTAPGFVDPSTNQHAAARDERRANLGPAARGDKARA